MTAAHAATVSAEMSAQRLTELAGDEAHYRLRKACMVRAIDLYSMLEKAHGELRFFERSGTYDSIYMHDIAQLLKEIHDAQ